MSNYRPRLSIDLTEEQRRGLDRIFPYQGLQKAIFSIIIDDLINAVNRHGPNVLSGLITRSIKLQNITELQNGDEDEDR